MYRPLQWPPGRCIPACTGQGVYPSKHWPGVYPSMHWARGCLARGVHVYPSMHWAGGWGYLPRGGVCPVHAGIDAHTPYEQNDRHMWKHNLAATMLRTVINSVLSIQLRTVINSVLSIQCPITTIKCFVLQAISLNRTKADNLQVWWNMDLVLLPGVTIAFR